MKKLIVFLLVVGGLYTSVGNALLDSGKANISAHTVKLEKMGL